MPSRKSGQSVVEFIFVILAFLNLFVVTFNATMAFAVQQYVSYATFMAARAFQASNESPPIQRASAEAVLRGYLFMSPADADEEVFRFGGTGKGAARDIKWEIPDANADLPAFGQMPPQPGRRIRVQFKVPLFQLPFGELSKDWAWVPLEAVSYLGRDPTIEECRKFFESFYNYYRRGGGAEAGPGGWVGMDDNNC
jgi:hypothetical protein